MEFEKELTLATKTASMTALQRKDLGAICIAGGICLIIIGVELYANH